VLNQTDAKTIANKLEAEITHGRRHDLVIVKYNGKYVAQYGISRSSQEQSHDYIPRQLYLSRKQCQDFQGCSVSLSDYFDILKSKQVLSES